MSQPATILDIARVANVSPSTVSRALRKETSHLVSPEKMKRILEVMDEMHYSPSRLARGLRNSRTKTINLVVSYSPFAFQTEIIPRLISGITEVLSESDYQLKLCMHQEGALPMVLREYFTDSDGVIYASHRLSAEDMIFLKTRSQNCVVLEDCIPYEQAVGQCTFSTIGITNEDGIADLVKFLVGLGHRRIGFVKGEADSRDGEERLRGYLRGMKEAELAVEERWILPGNYLEDSGREAMRFIKANLPELTACVFACDDMAIGALDEARVLGIEVPKDFSIVGYDDVRLARFCSPRLTTVTQPRETIGNSAARCLLNQIGSEKYRVVHLRIPHQLNIRESAAAPRAT